VLRPHRLSSVTRMASISRGLSQGEDLLALRSFLGDGEDLVTGTLGEGAQISLLAFAGLTVETRQ
jgi:hypothetical protein